MALVATLLTSGVIGDNEDRIGTIMTMVSEMAKNVANISEALKETTNHVAKVESTLDDVVRRESMMEKMVKDLDKKIEGQLNAMDTKIENIEASRNRFPYGWKYLGRGDCGMMSDDFVGKQPITFTECVNFCEKKRLSGGASWNGMVYYANDQSCFCYKNDMGHNMGYPKALHFRFE